MSVMSWMVSSLTWRLKMITTPIGLKKMLRRKYGESVLVHMNGDPHPVVSSGSAMMNRLSGIGGFPCGRISEIFGAESSGKTTLAVQSIASAQVNDKFVAFIDADYGLSLRYAQHLGVDLKRFVYCQPDSLEDAFEMALKLIKTSALSALVIDSLPALPAREEIRNAVGDHFWKHGEIIARGLRLLLHPTMIHNVSVIITNQLRMRKYGGIVETNRDWYETTPCGSALRYYTTIRVELNTIYANGTQAVHIDIKKNLLAPPCRTGRANIVYGDGFVD